MVTAIHLYVEGGGDSSDTRIKLRKGFGDFLAELREAARAQRIGWKLIACGSRNDAFDDFCTALKQDPEAFNVLLVDAESSVDASTVDPSKYLWRHLKNRDDWDCPARVDDSHCFLMEQSMETWLIADKSALVKYYGQGFLVNALPQNPKIESLDKVELLNALTKATTKTRKGPYHKTKHAFEILAKADPRIVRDAASHCERLFKELNAQMIG